MTQAPAPVEFWFDFSSPYAYFAAQTIESVASKHHRPVLWRPFMLGVAFKATGMTSLSQTPLRGDYARHDWLRLARRAGIPFELPDGHPATQLSASRAYYWIEENEPDAASTFAARTFHAYFAAGQDTSSPEIVAGIAAACGLDPRDVLGAIALASVKEKVRVMTDEALRRGIFGSPFFIVDGEPFWGHDRLPMVDEWLDRGGW
ncbi:2-hydroxychromene-2-carboxylate isomerase [Methylocystis sp. 9N]|uniref:2-hydroxychromene-2-carboxylate isomerase n=1 Tax=Methylocystis borbori TaxID=3118750 RepID=A0ABU7XD46_9HYPH